MTPRPHPALQPTCYGLRPPHAAELKRSLRLQLLQAEQQQRLLMAGPPAAPAPSGLRGWLRRWLAGG